MDELALKRIIQEAEQAKATIETHRKYWQEVIDDLWGMWKDSKSDDVNGREQIFREYHAIMAINTKLQRAVDRGKKAEEEIRQLEIKHRHGN